MQLMQHPVNDRPESDGGNNEDCESTVERVESSEELAGDTLRRRNGTHSGKDHRGVDVCVDPAHAFEVMVSDHSGSQGAGDE